MGYFGESEATLKKSVIVFIRLIEHIKILKWFSIAVCSLFRVSHREIIKNTVAVDHPVDMISKDWFLIHCFYSQLDELCQNFEALNYSMLNFHEYAVKINHN